MSEGEIMPVNLCLRRRPVASAMCALALVAMSGCGDGGGSTNQSPSPTPAPAPAPAPPPTTQFSAPFGLAADRVLDVFGWQANAQGSLVPATDVGFRWNAQASSYELMMPGQQWGRLTGNGPFYAVYNQDGTQQPYAIGVGDNKPTVEGPSPRTPVYAHPANATPAGNNTLLSATFAFGVATATGSVPLTGTRTCYYNVDDAGDGTLTIDLATGSVTGHLHQFYGSDYVLPPTQFTPGATTFTATGPAGPIDGRFYGPQATEVAVRWKHPNGFTMVWIMICDSA